MIVIIKLGMFHLILAAEHLSDVAATFNIPTEWLKPTWERLVRSMRTYLATDMSNVYNALPKVAVDIINRFLTIARVMDDIGLLGLPVKR